MSIKSTLITLIIFTSLFSTHAQSEQGLSDITSIKKIESYTGLSIREQLHVGALFGNQTSIGGYVGHINGFSAGLNLKRHFNGNSKYNNYSSYFFRLGVGMNPDGSRFSDGQGNYWHIATTLGGDFQLSKSFGFSLDLGMWYRWDDYDPDDPALFFEARPLLPVISFKFFHLVRK